MEWMIGRTVDVDPTSFMIVERSRTNKLKCSHCKNQIKKGQAVLLTYNYEGKIIIVNCGECPDGLLGLESFEEHIIMEEIYGIGQD